MPNAGDRFRELPLHSVKGGPHGVIGPAARGEPRRLAVS